ncbi:hypothetical protein M501DRAFT_965657 [Patellaria atrata CBS 101060]|uniref:Eisosome protein 1 n=1 Tax=Patellaria atrata CBS 101060 TaxID=1346257 RepID=A0A9P4SJC0_9PEZI|nr:hypothetical protein M501DRAFT_965657 [Patellaria atrata CBS 101060]
MAHTHAGLPSGDVPCPDPSVHGKDTRLQEQASTAALYASNAGDHKSAKSSRDIDPLDADGKLSSASAATSLKYAQPQDLPAYPIVGIEEPSNSAHSAANLANNNQKTIEPWRPDPSSAAGKAALAAKDYKPAPLWKPEESAAGSKAALRAARDGPKVNLWTPEATKVGNSAAGIAFRNKGLSPHVERGTPSDSRKKALMAATGAMSGRQRSGSTPTPIPSYPDEANSAHNALNAATVANRPQGKPQAIDSNRLSSPAMQAARAQNLGRNVNRQMYTEHPPVSIEVEEKKRQDALRASAVSMAKKMFEIQQAHIDAASETSRSDGRAAATAVHGRRPSTTTETDIREQAMQYIHLQDAAHKLAAERLAKLNPDESAAFRSYYGYEKESPRSRLSIRRGRRRASSEGGLADSDDEERSRKIRSQMSLFNDQVAQVDAKKRQIDRDSLMAAAERKVHAQMHSIDEKVFNETGKASPAMMEEWEARARAKAAADSKARMANYGRVHIGGGKYLDQSEVDAIAQSKIQPTLDEINTKAEQQRARDEELRLDQEQKKRELERERQRAAELKAEEKRSKDEDKAAAKARKAEDKAAENARKEIEKAKAAEEKRLEKDQKRKSRAAAPTEEPMTEIEALPEADTGPDLTADLAVITSPTSDISLSRPDSAEDQVTSPTSPMSPAKESKGLKSLLNKLKRRSKPPADESPNSPSEKSFIGGAALTGTTGPKESNSSIAEPGVDLSTLSGPAYTSREGGKQSARARSPSISSLSSEEEDRGRTGRRVSDVSSGEDFEEARDHFDEGLAPPPSFGSLAKEKTGSPVRDSRFSEDL